MDAHGYAAPQLCWIGGQDARPQPDGHGGKALTLDARYSRRATTTTSCSSSRATAASPTKRPTRTGRGRASRRPGTNGSPELRGTVAPNATRRHAYAVLAGLTSAGGGMVAAATTSLPERARQGRNYDYRYVWIRDQCYAGQAVAKAGPHPLMDDAVRFVVRAPARGRTRPQARLHDQRRRRARRAQARTRRISRRRRTSSATGSTSSSSSTRSARRCCCSRRPQATTTSTPTAGAPPRSPSGRSSSAGRSPRSTPASGRSNPTHGLTAASSAPPACARSPAAEPPASRLRAGSRSPTGSSSDTAAHALAPVRTLAALTHRPTRLTQRCCSRRSAARSRRRTRARSRPCTRSLDELTEDGYCYRYRPDERPLGQAEGAFLLCGFSCRSPTTSRATTSPPPAGSSATVPPADLPVCALRSSTSASDSCAGTCPRRSCTHCCSSAPSNSRIRPPRARERHERRRSLRAPPTFTATVTRRAAPALRWRLARGFNETLATCKPSLYAQAPRLHTTAGRSPPGRGPAAAVAANTRMDARWGYDRRLACRQHDAARPSQPRMAQRGAGERCASSESERIRHPLQPTGAQRWPSRSAAGPTRAST